ncbi:p450 domain containing protein [Asbolus verrucosus]|uniref:p450 domain containing protein n=1 Tax=Asbolus verrucosus TaxID=1661398 RepID=A0A482V9M6_ASBVE|nr:p450 domain containing protein [Asbolus verrucosus]
MDLEKYANVTNICLFVFGVSFIFWLIKYNWNRRWLYYHASKIDGPFALPIIGSTHHLYIHRKELIRWSTTLFRKYDGSIFKIWLGPSLIILLTRPKDVEVVLKSCLNKPSAYEFTIPLLGRGLITAEVEKWKQHRKLINLTFNQKILNSYVDTFVKHSNILTEKLKTTSGEIQVIERKRRENLDGTKMKTSSKGNFLDHLITMTDKEGKWTQEELMEETQTMIITATDTTINTECFVILMLSMHLDIQQKVYEEISEILGTSNRDIDVKDLDQLTYLERTKFAMMKIKVTIATILRQFELTSSQFKSVKDVKMEYHFVLSSPHFKITLKSR